MRRALAFAAALAAAVLAGPAGGELRLTPEAARNAAAQALGAGDPATARLIARALVARDPADAAAALVLAQAEDWLGNPAAARAAARAAHAAARDPAERFRAARQAALVDHRAGRHTSAQLWLRRAAAAAPDAAAAAQARREFRIVRATNPATLTIRVAVAPTSNLNNGSRHDRITIDGLPFALSGEARALSGTTATLGASWRRRLAGGPGGLTELHAGFTLRKARLSAEARALAPAARGRDYDHAAVEAGISRRFRVAGWPGTLSVGLTAGHSWFGGADLADTLRLDLGAERAMGERAVLHAGLSLERQRRHDSARNSATVAGVSLGLLRALPDGGRLRLSFGARHTDAASLRVAHDALVARAEWTAGQSVAGIRLGAALGVEARRYGASALAPGGRRDLRLEGEVSMVFERIGYMGFSPSLDIRVARNGSNVALYDGRDIGVTLGIRSTF
jgi:hypothetical protein